MWRSVNKANGLIFVQVLAFWPVWRWYFIRMSDSSDEPWGLLALGTALFFICRKGKIVQSSRSPSALIFPAILILLYGGTFHLFPPLMRAVMAVTAIAFTIAALRPGRAFHLGTLGLFLLALPVMPTLQFYLGYPLQFLPGM